MIALVVSAIVIAGARTLLGEVGDGAIRISDAARQADKSANAERTLRSLAQNLARGSTQNEFGGDARRATFSSWCDMPAGWQERCEISVTVESRPDGDALVLRSTAASDVIVRDQMRHATLRYLTTVKDGGDWIHEWGAGMTAPLAIAIIMDADTLIVPIGERG
jgi:hypothetical protein